MDEKKNVKKYLEENKENTSILFKNMTLKDFDDNIGGKIISIADYQTKSYPVSPFHRDITKMT